jgi:thiamine kinase-like enzyme
MVAGPENKLSDAMHRTLSEGLKLVGREAHEIVSVDPLSGTGNQSLLVTFESEKLVFRFDGGETEGLVDRDHEYCHAAIAARCGIGPDVVRAEPELGILVTGFVEGTGFHCLARPFDNAVLKRLADSLKVLQATSGFSGVMDPWQKMISYLEDAGSSDPAAPNDFGETWRDIESLGQQAILQDSELVACHVDLVPENILETDTGIVFVDWEYAARSHRLWDVAYFASEASLSANECQVLLESLGYGSCRQEFGAWLLTTKAVSLAWCLARRRRAEYGNASWDMETRRRRADLQASLVRAKARGWASLCS